MRMLRYKLLYLISLLVLLSCAERTNTFVTETESKLSATISVVVPQMPNAHIQTRAMALAPQIQNLYLAVFDDNGYLLEYVKAKEVELATENGIPYIYEVELTPTDYPTTVHLIGNAPESIRFGTEVEAVGSLYTEYGEDAYWQRVVLPNGIVQQADGALDPTVGEALTGIRLIRNFAWIQLKTRAQNFTLDSYCVVNTRDKGSIAPYNTSNSHFAEFSPVQTYADLVNEGYNGFIPAEAEVDKTIPDETEWYHVDGSTASTDEYAYFVYEREKPISDPSFILVKGTYKTNAGTELPNRYYKVDMRDKDGNYFPIIRGFRYAVEITNVLHEGHETPEAAAAGAGSGDVSTAIETEDFTNISNNMARIFVSYTDTTLVEGNSEVTLRYKFVVFGINGEQQQILNGDNVEVSTQPDGAVIDSWRKAENDDEEGWREITLSTKALADVGKSQDIVIKGTATVNDQTYQLQRKVTFNLRPKYTMSLVCNPNEVEARLGSPFDIIIKIPGGLSQSMFPLEFELEADKLSMTPDLGDDLPVVTGRSIIPGKDKTTIGFVKSLEWVDYDALSNEGGYKSIPCLFKTNRDESATLIYAQNKYFDLATAELRNYIPHTFSNFIFEPTSLPEEVDSEVDFTFTMSQLPEQGYVVATLEYLEPADDETRLAYLDVVDGRARYLFNPSSTTETLHLKTTAEDIVASVKLSAYHFEEALASLEPAKRIIPAGNIKVGTTNIPRNTTITFTLYTRNPGTTSSDPGYDFASFTARRNGSNNNDIELTHEQYQAIEANGGYVYVRFSRYGRYYIASAKLADLMSKAVTLSFSYN